MGNEIDRKAALAAIDALRFGDIAHDKATLAHNRALSEAMAAICALPSTATLAASASPETGDALRVRDA